MKLQFLILATEYLKETHEGPQSLAALFERVYTSGVFDERYGDWCKDPTLSENIEVAVQDKSGNSSIQERPYEAGINEFTKIGIRS